MAAGRFRLVKLAAIAFNAHQDLFLFGIPRLNKLEQLLYHCHIGAEYDSYSGDRVVLDFPLRLRFLEALGYDIANDSAVAEAIHQLDAQPWCSWLADFNVMVIGDSEFIDIRVSESEIEQPLNWQIDLEQPTGAVASTQDAPQGVVTPASLDEVGEYYIDGTRYSAHRLAPGPLPPGYHQITVFNNERSISAPLVVAPARCYEDIEPEEEPAPRLLGVSCQLYTLRSDRNWGIGDFSDLAELVSLSAAAGIDMVCLNPLHAPHLAGADFASPYSPSDRRFLNPLYIDPEAIDGFATNREVSALIRTRSFQQKIAKLREAEWVDYDGVAELKYWVFEALFNEFSANELAAYSGRSSDFMQFVEQQGESLQTFAEIEAGQSVAGVAGAAFAAGLKAAKDPLFHQYLQWIASEQLSRCQQQALASGMRIGLMGDLAVGAVSGGAEVIARPELFCTNASIGAPPDPFSATGQNWCLPPIDPVALQRDRYRHFIELIRANMQFCGALRIDHVMGLLRLWWCLPQSDDGTASGAYVYYPLETLLAIIRLESYRNRCLVVGEDMGVVPDEIRRRMKETAMYTNKVFYFERDLAQNFTWPDEHPVRALLMVTNHDVSTLAGWWNTTDLQLRRDCGNIAKQDYDHELNTRQHDKQKLLSWLNALNLLPQPWQGEDATVQPFDMALCEAILHSCVRSQSRLLSFQLDDLQLLETPVNIPGTYREYPNWRRKQQQTTAALFNDNKVAALLHSMVKERK